jgi:hypothetical protein
MAAVIETVPHRLIGRPGPARGVPRRASWQPTAHCVRWWPRRLQQQQWSPEQIAGWLQATYPDYPDDAEMQVSHETI